MGGRGKHKKNCVLVVFPLKLVCVEFCVLTLMNHTVHFWRQKSSVKSNSGHKPLGESVLIYGWCVTSCFINTRDKPNKNCFSEQFLAAIIDTFEFHPLYRVKFRPPTSSLYRTLTTFITVFGYFFYELQGQDLCLPDDNHVFHQEVTSGLTRPFGEFPYNYLRYRNP